MEFAMSLGHDVIPDYPFNDGNWAALRHRDNKRCFAFIYDFHGRLQVNLKCRPEWTSFWRNAHTGVTPGYHMNKTHWNTLILDGSIPDEDIKTMTAESYQLTAPDAKKQIKNK